MFGYSRQAYYKDKSERKIRHHQFTQLRALIIKYRIRMPRIGTRKLYYLIKAELLERNLKIGRDVLFKFLRAEQMLIKPKRSYVKTTNSKHWMKKYPSLIENREITRPEQVWVSDITYIKTEKGNAYLSLITDAYSKKIMGYALLNSLSTQGPLMALDMAITNRKYSYPLIHHSDRGLQYCCSSYIDKLKKSDISISMTQNGDPYENAIAERVNGILKYEFLLVEGFKDHNIALQVIKESIEIYNNERPHLTCRMLTPSQAHKQQKIKNIKWNKKAQRLNLRA